MALYFGVITFQSDCFHYHSVFPSLFCVLANGFDLCSGISALGSNARAGGFLLHMNTKEWVLRKMARRKSKMESQVGIHCCACFKELRELMCSMWRE